MSEDIPAETIANSRPRLADQVECIPNDIGTVNLRGPELRRSAPGRFMAWLLRLPKRVEVELDDVGAMVIENMDGADLKELAGKVGSKLKLTRREAEAAVTIFIRSLLRRQLVVLEGLEAGQ